MTRELKGAIHPLSQVAFGCDISISTVIEILTKTLRVICVSMVLFEILCVYVQSAFLVGSIRWTLHFIQLDNFCLFVVIFRPLYLM